MKKKIKAEEKEKRKKEREEKKKLKFSEKWKKGSKRWCNSKCMAEEKGKNHRTSQGATRNTVENPLPPLDESEHVW